MRAGLCLFLFVGIAAAQVQSAPDAQAGLSGSSALAQGSLAVISGLSGGPFANLSATVSLLPADSTAPIPAQVTLVSPYAITFVVPANVPLGDAQLIYKLGTQATQWTRVSIVAANLSLYRTGGIGPLQAQNINADGTPVANGLASPAQPGQPVVLWGTGLGSTPRSAVQITLGGVPQTVLYAGTAPGEPGLNQINFQVAAGTPDGCYVPLTITYGTQSLTSFLSKTSDGLPCHHPFQLSADTMKMLDSGGQIATGQIELATGIQSSAPNRASRQESAQILPLFLTASALAVFARPANAPSASCSIPSSGSGIAGSFLEGGFDITTLGTLTLKSATSTLTLPWTQPQQTDSPLNSLPAPAIPGGNWTFSTSGGSALPASSFNFVLPPPLQLAGSSPVTLNRSQDQTISWDGSGFDSAATLQLSLSAQYSGSPVLTCVVPAQVGTVTLPSTLLTKFSAGFSGTLSSYVSEPASSLGHAQFNQLNGTPLLMIVNWSSSDVRPVDFQ